MIQYLNIEWRKLKIASILLFLPPSVGMLTLVYTNMDFSHIHQYGALMYCVTLQVANFAASSRLSRFGFTNPAFLFSWIGYILFICSDYFLISKEFGLSNKLRRVEIMSTYIFAQIFLMSGSIFTEKWEQKCNKHK